MTARPKTAVAGMKIRLREPLRAKLEAAAKKKGISLNKELTFRVEQTFIKDDALGGVDARQIALAMAAAFTLAASRKGKETMAKDFANDPASYLAGIQSVIGELMTHAPRQLTGTERNALVSVILTHGGKNDGTR